MGILSPDFDIDDKTISRSVQSQMIVDEVLKHINHISVLLLDPNDEFDLRTLQNKLEGETKYYDLSQCKAGDYVDFINQFVLPLVNGQIDYLLVDNIDKTPDIEDIKDFKNILKYLAKGGEYDPFQNVIYTEENNQRIKRTGVIDFDNYQNRLIMRCGTVPSFLDSFTYYVIDCRQSALWVHHYLELSQIEEPLMLIFGGEAGDSNTRLSECKQWLHEMFPCVDSIGHPFKQGHDHMFDEKGNLQNISDHPELLNKAILPTSVTPETDLLLIHRYVDQFNYDAALKYALDVVSEHHLPVIYLANSYELEQNPGADLKGFEIHTIE